MQRVKTDSFFLRGTTKTENHKAVGGQLVHRASFLRVGLAKLEGTGSGYRDKLYRFAADASNHSFGASKL